MTEQIRLVYGNGGRFSQELMSEHILPYFSNDMLDVLHDGAQFTVPAGRMAFTTDSYVVTPAVFPGGNIGKLAVCGTVNDLAMNGAVPQYLSCGLILEEGLPLTTLHTVLATMRDMAAEAGVAIITGDTKVVEKGAVDGIYINTAGIGCIPEGVAVHPGRIEPGQAIIVTGAIGDHAVSVMGTRYGLTLPASIQTDCAPLNYMIQDVLTQVGSAVRCMRDPTRGGLATTLQELATQADVGVLIEEASLVVHEEVRGVCQMLGYDPLYLANEGKAVLIVEAEAAETVLSTLRSHPYGQEAVCIGHTLAQNKGKVGLKTQVGGIRLLTLLGEDQVPRIC